jgi:hypothetical protein
MKITDVIPANKIEIFNRVFLALIFLPIDFDRKYDLKKKKI